ncbi:MAG: glycosyltransferase family 39 protein [Polyangiaceae bacterium]|nr:glycosyltransferase family 39 protein [Polyangiaceae bacterium]
MTRRTRLALVVIAAAFAVRAAIVLWASSRIGPTADGTFYNVIGARIAQGLGYTWLWPDGAVTNAGHYPIGYPALVGLAYTLLGTHPSSAMWANAALGTSAAFAAFRAGEQAGGERAALAAGLLTALHPGLVLYTPALMTEGVTAALVLIAAALAIEGSARPNPSYKWPALAGVVMGLATLVRPQSLLLAPILGLLAVSRGASSPRVRRSVAALLALAAALAVCTPWTIRNCVHMKRCALVSHNGGWNLLIGTDASAGGSWAPVKVPPECREVFDEAEKDVCFGAAARREIAEHPLRWLALAPQKWAVTFNYAGAGPWYLNASNPQAFSDKDKTAWGGVEIVFERAALAAAIGVVAFPFVRRTIRDLRRRPRSISPRDLAVILLALLGFVAAFSLHAWVSFFVGGPLFWLGASWLAHSAAPSPDRSASLPPGRTTLLLVSGAVLASLVITHAVFFGAGRYSLVAFPFVTTVAALAFSQRPRATPKAEGPDGEQTRSRGQSPNTKRDLGL